MARRDQTVDKRLVLGVEHRVERREVGVPLLLGTRAYDRRGYEPVAHDPGYRKRDRREPLGLRALGDFAGDLQRLRPPFGLHDAHVVAPCPRTFRRRRLGIVLAAQDTARERAVGRDADAEMAGGGELLDLGQAVDDVVQWLADHRPVHT